MGGRSVFSTYVEVILLKDQDNLKVHSVLHVCGGDPTFNPRRRGVFECSPRMWR